MSINQTLGPASGWIGECLSWVDQQVGVAGWGNQSAADAYVTMGGNPANLTSTPQPGDVVLFGSNSDSTYGHAGIVASNNAGSINILSVLPAFAGQPAGVRLTDLNTLIGFEGDSNPIFVKASSIGPKAQALSQATIADWQAEIDKIGGGSGSPGTNPITIVPPLPGTTGTTGTGTTTGTGQTETGASAQTPVQTGVFLPQPSTPGSANVGCNPPGLPPINPLEIPTYIMSILSYWFCVLMQDVKRLAIMLMAAFIVMLGVWLFSKDREAPAVVKVPVQQAEKTGKSAAGSIKGAVAAAGAA